MFLKLFDRWRRPLLSQLLTIYLRYLIGSAFLIAAIGMGKLSGGGPLLSIPGQSLCDLQPIQQFFRVMADSGLYWKFIGWTQIFAGILLITQRFARVGALIFFGMILNIFVITVSYDFKGTPVVAGLMLLVSIYLLIWDADTLQYLFRTPRGISAPSPVGQAIHQDPFWSLLGLCLIACIAATMWLKINPLMVMISALLTGMAGLIFFFWRRRITISA
jgi:uncharacterized membrane protein YphA (DoxX/SURF4 family)